MKKPYGLLWILVLLSAALMSLPWLVPHCGALALIAFLPLLTADRVADQNGVRRFWIWHYSTFVLWNAATTFWVANATLGGAVFAILANSLQMSLVFGLFRFSKKRLGGVLPYVFSQRPGSHGNAGIWFRPRYPGPGWCSATLSPAAYGLHSGMNSPGPWAARSGYGLPT